MTTATPFGAARESALVVPDASLGALVVTGGDRQTWLNGLVTCDLAKVAAGGGVYGLVVTVKGRIVSDVVLIVGKDDVTLVAPVSQMAELQSMFDQYLIMEDAEMRGEPDAWVAHVHGPKSALIVEAALREGAKAATVDRTGLGGGVIVASAADAVRVEAKVREVVQREGGALGSFDDWTALRIERGVPAFGIDFGPTTYPQEAGLEKTAVSFNKGCYLGQEVVCMLEMRGHANRKLALVRVEGAEVPDAGAQVETSGGAVVGQVTSAVASSVANGVLALAMIKRSALESTESLRVGGVAVSVCSPV